MIKKRLYRYLFPILAIVFWLTVWEILSRLLDVDFVFPSVIATLKAFVSLLGTFVFWSGLSLSLARVLLGFSIGLLVGCALAPLAHRYEFVRVLITPMMGIIKSTPVASFIMVLWFFRV